MLAKSNNSASQKSLWVKNLSKTKQLSSSEQKVFEKGLNFAITPKRIPVLDIVASVEKGFKNVRNQSAVELARSKITRVLSNSRLPPPNLSPEEKKALQELRSDHTIRIMRADKDNCTVIMDKKDYDDKIMHLLNDRNV